MLLHVLSNKHYFYQSTSRISLILHKCELIYRTSISKKDALQVDCDTVEVQIFVVSNFRDLAFMIHRFFHDFVGQVQYFN